MRYSGEAGRVTPGKGREQDTRPPNPRPATSHTTSNTTEAHTINTDDDHDDDPHLGQQPRPQRRTHEKPAPSTTTTVSTTTQTSASSYAHLIEHSCGTHHRHPQVNDLDNDQPPHNQPQYSGVGHSGEAGGVTPGKGRGTGRGSAPKDVDMTTTWGIHAATSPNSTTSTNVPTRPRKCTHHNPQPV